ncbi:MAG: phosphatidate cytidylyltransferase [Gammaproteobacteria bacterium]|nr:phosphatidate cytidylyltransferase [Gammaproteobacteria bacterium]
MLAQRVFTAVVLLGVFGLITVFSTPFIFALVLAFLVLLGGVEWTHFIGLKTLYSRIGYLLSLVVLMVGLIYLLGINPSATELESRWVISVLLLGSFFWLLAILLIRGYPGNKKDWADEPHIALMGVFVLIPTWVGIVQLKYLDNSGMLFLALLGLVSVSDIGAYFTGKAWGKSKLAPLVSPNKSWAGFWGGMVCCVALCVIMVVGVNRFDASISVAQSLLIIVGSGVVFLSSVIGDLFESMMKRNRQLKDSGTLLPGHGGILDRIDSMTAAAPISVLLLVFILAELWNR